MATSTESCSNHDFDRTETSFENAVNTDTTNPSCYESKTNEDYAHDAVVVNGISTQMEEDQQPESLKSNHFSIDDIPEPIKVLDDILSAFEDPSSQKPTVTVANGENQSEDDGYMSLSRKNMHKKDSLSSDTSVLSGPVPGTPPKANKNFQAIKPIMMGNGDCCITENVTISKENTQDPSIIQNTLPKVRTNPAVAANYSSLPCCGVRYGGVIDHKMRGGGSCNGERNVLGIDISAVHKAVLRGGFIKLPEPIINEHPITIYPGRYSPPSDSGNGIRSRPNRLVSSVEKHKEVCHILNPLSSISSSSSASSPSTGLSENKTHSHSSPPTSDAIANKLYTKTSEIEHKLRSASEDEFSEDSIEEQRSLSPPLQLSSIQSTPKKNSGIAWEIHFKGNKKRSKPSKSKVIVSSSSNKKAHADAVNSNFLSHVLQDFESFEAGPLYLEDTEQSAYSSDERLNYCMHRHTNMLGKGTFIIRRATKTKPPKAIDIFQTNIAPSKQLDLESPPNDIEQYDRLPFDSLKDMNRQTDIFNCNPRQSLELSILPCLSLTSPRDRLSLNIESQQHINSLAKEARSTSSEEFTKSFLKGIPIPNEIQQQSKESIINQASCLDADSIDGPQTNASNFDACNMFIYKNANSKNSDYTSELRTPNTTTPHTDLAPTLEEDEEQYSDFSYGCTQLQPIETTEERLRVEANISALLRGEIAVVRATDVPAHTKRSLEFRPGVHKSESAKEMLLSQNVAFGPLPPSPPSSNPDLFDYDALPPLPPSPTAAEAVSVVAEDLIGSKSFMRTTSVEIHSHSSGDEMRSRDNISALRNMSDELPLPPPPPPTVPPHRGHSVNTIKSWSIDSNYKKKSPKMLGYGSGITTPTSGPGMLPPNCDGSYSTKRYVSYGTKRSLRQSPREEHRLQTSCSLPETPIFARGCDIPRTPFRRQNENTVSGSRTAPRSSTSHSINMGNSIVGIAGGNSFSTGMCRQRSINHALASNEMLRLSGVPARGWYPKQRSMRPASTENIDRLTSIRVWDSTVMSSTSGQARKPLTLPPNLTPSFLNKSPREALRRVTSLLITKKKNTKERKNKAYSENTMESTNKAYDHDTSVSTNEPPPLPCKNPTQQQKPQKKKGLFKNLWKRTKHFSLDQ